MTVDAKLLDDLNFLSSVLLVSRSSLITELLTPSCIQMRGVIELTNSATGNSGNSGTLARDPEKVRSYIEGLSKAIADQKGQYDAAANLMLSEMDTDAHGH